MRKIHLLSIAALIALGAAAAGPLGMMPTPPLGLDARTNVRKAPLRLIDQPGYYLENFEDCPGNPDFTFPQGWVTTPNPGDGGDLWRVGTITKEGEPIQGPSGTKYAFILGTGTPHDAWAVSPAIAMEAGKDYDISFYSVMFSGDNAEGFEVSVLSSQNISSTPIARYAVTDEDRDNRWFRFKETFSPAVSGNYYIAFHSNAGGDLNYGTVIDDLKITNGSYPVFNGDTFLEMGEKGSLDAAGEATYYFLNLGDSPLTVRFESQSDDITVVTPEVTAEADGEYYEARIRFTGSTVGDYTGYVKVTTNDPSAAQFNLKVTATVRESRKTGYIFEDFESGGPEGWTLCKGSVNTSDYGAHNGSARAFSTSSYYTTLDENSDGVGFKTHYVEMGAEPVFRFWYKLYERDFFGPTGEPTPADKPRMRLLATDDFGATWKEVYLMEPGGEHEHKPSDDFQELEIALPQLAGKTCCFRMLFTHFSDDIMEVMMNPFGILVDDVAIGTPIPQDAKAGYLKGATEVKAGEAHDYTVTVTNGGTQVLPEAQVNLTDATDGTILKTAKTVELQPGASTDVTLSWTAPEAGTYKLKAVIVADDDVAPANDSSNILYISALPVDNSSVTVETGNVKTSQSLPVNFYSVESEVQSLYYANEIGMTKGQIGSISIFPYMTGDFLSEPFEVYLYETDRENFDDGKFEPYKAMTKVFEGQALFASGESEFVIPFDTPYDYKGGNLIVCTRKLGKEFINSKEFIIHESNITRSIYADTNDAGKLEDQKDNRPILSNVIARMKFNRVMAPSGTVTGKVSDANGAVRNADVRVEGTRLHALTDADGKYTLTGVAAGTHNLEVTCHRYYDKPGNAVTVTASQQAVRDITISTFPLYTLSGQIRSAATDGPIEGARVDVEGYDDFTVYTDIDGRYEIKDVCGEDGFDYILRVTDGYYDNYAKSITVRENVTIDAALTERELPASHVKASQTDGEINVTWQQPLPEMGYDDGKPIDHIGFPKGYREIIMGTAYHGPMVIEEVRWFVSDDEPHANFNVIIFGLNADGTPNSKDIIYADYGVDYIDNDWTVYTLRKPLKVDGCLVAISCSGFLGIGATAITAEYPLKPGMHYYAGESYQLGIFDFALENYNYHIMLRAYGYRLDADGKPIVYPREPSAGYKLYRLPAGKEDADNWISIGAAAETFLNDTTPFEDGRYRYAAVASYKSGDAKASFSPVVRLSHSGLHNLGADSGIRVEGNTIIAPDGAQIYTASGICVNGRDLFPGIYLVKHNNTVIKILIK